MTREAILGAIRAVPLPSSELPDLKEIGPLYPDPVEQFKTALKAVGGDWVEIDSMDQIEEYLRVKFPDAKNRFCEYSGAKLTAVHSRPDAEPHGLKDLDLVAVRGDFGVAENAAIGVTSERVPHRVAYFCAQHLVLVLGAKDIVHNMHQAYDRIDLGNLPYGAFISGPSKTADIEQCLVIGAHGPRSLTVVLDRGRQGG